MVLKLTAFGLKEYCKNRWNLFDGTIVILSLADMILSHSGAISGAGLSVLRTFRLVSRTCLTFKSFHLPMFDWVFFMVDRTYN